jgi:hypothetical protein
MPRLHTALSIVTLGLLTAAPLRAQQAPLYIRHRSPQFGRVSPYAAPAMPQPLTMEQQLAIAPVKYPAVWPAPKVPAGTVLTVPPRPKGLPGVGEYWGPFTDDLGGWGFMVGPLPAPPPPPQQPWSDFYNPRQRVILTQPAPDPQPPAPPALPVAGPISPDGRMVVTYPDGNQVTWQLPMVEYVATFAGIGPGGGFWLTDKAGHRGAFGVAQNVRYTLNGRLVDARKVPAGTAVRALALKNVPKILTALAFTR